MISKDYRLLVARELFDGLDTAVVDITEFNFPYAKIKAEIQTYRGDFFEQFTKLDSFHVRSMHNLSTDGDKVWHMEIKFNKLFEEDITNFKDKYVGVKKL